MSDGYRCKTIRRECASAKTRVALGKPGTWMKSKRDRASLGMKVSKSSQKWSVRRSVLGDCLMSGQFHFFEIGGHGEFAIADRIELNGGNRCAGFLRAVLLCREPSPDGQAG